jgi:hypothetical protein
VNCQKDVWACFVCDAHGKAWKLAAFISGLDPKERTAVADWLREHGLLPKKRRSGRRAGESQGEILRSHVYTDADGHPLAKKIRWGSHDSEKDAKLKHFSWQRREGEEWVNGLDEKGQSGLPLYRIAEIRNADWAVVTEGEHDADAGAALDLPTVTSGAAGTWRDDHSETLRGKVAVYIVPHCDEKGRADAEHKAQSLYGKVALVKICELPTKDLAEALEKKIWPDPLEELRRLFKQSPEWKPITGSEILDWVLAFVRRFVSLTLAQARAIVLWIVHTHAIESADFTPYLDISSPAKESGKTRTLEVAQLLVANPWSTENASPAAMVRKIHGGAESGKPVTVLLDERDSQHGGDKERAEVIRGILNSGYQRGGCYSRCVGEGANQIVCDFSTFAPKAISGIGPLTDTVASRSVPIRMKRARRRQVDRLRKRGREGHKVLAEAASLKARLAAWCQEHLQALEDAEPEIPSALSDRQADCCEPLLAITDLAGGAWPEAARLALVELCTRAQTDDDSIGVKLLSDIRDVFRPRGDDGIYLTELDSIASCELVKSLIEMEGRPWAEWGKFQKPITPTRLARLLFPYGIGPKPIRSVDGHVFKGYEQAQFVESWDIYLPAEPSATCSAPPSPPDPNGYTVTNRMNTEENDIFKPLQTEACNRSENAVSPNKDADCNRVTDSKRGEGEREATKKAPRKVRWET